MASPVRSDPRWNINVHYHPIVLDAIPGGARTALDVGCGDGLLTFDLAERGLRATGVDPHAATIERARSDPRANRDTQFIVGDLFTTPFELGSFDVVASVAMLHHVDAEAGIRRMRELVRPGGVLALIGFARASTLGDHARAGAGLLLKGWMQVRGRYWEHHAPVVWPPPMTSKEMNALVERELPGAAFRSLLSNRFSALWRRPR